MGTFQKTETVDARQFIGGVDDAMNLVLWVTSQPYGVATWDETRDTISLNVWGRFHTVYHTDWIIFEQDGTFNTMRNEDFIESGFKQV